MPSARMRLSFSVNTYALYLMSEATRAFDEKRLGYNDYRDIIAEALADSNAHPEFITRITRICGAQPTLLRMLLQEQAYFAMEVFDPLRRNVYTLERSYYNLRDRLGYPLKRSDLVEREVSFVRKLTYDFMNEYILSTEFNEPGSGEDNVLRLMSWSYRIQSIVDYFRKHLVMRYGSHVASRFIGDEDVFVHVLLGLNEAHLHGKVTISDCLSLLSGLTTRLKLNVAKTSGLVVELCHKDPSLKAWVTGAEFCSLFDESYVAVMRVIFWAAASQLSALEGDCENEFR